MAIFPGLFYIIPILGFLIFIHEMGHFLVARAYGIQVNEFGFGFPPRLFGIRRGETIYSINLIPLGGFVKMVGEEDPSHPRSLAGKPLFVRFMVISAGPFMNLLVPIVIFSILFAVIAPRIIEGTVQIVEVVRGSPAAEAGLRPGDAIISIDGEQVTTFPQLRDRIQQNAGQEMEWQVVRDWDADAGLLPEPAAASTIHVVPRVDPPPGQGRTGISITTVGTAVTGPKPPIWKAIPLGVQHLWDLLGLMWEEISGWVRGTTSPQVSGPIGIAQVTSEVSRFGAIPLINLAAVISINLAIVNFLPIPALDGGRLLFLAIEWVRRGKRISPQKEGLVHLVGFAILIGLILSISYFDVVRLIRGETLLP